MASFFTGRDVAFYSIGKKEETDFVVVFKGGKRNEGDEFGREFGFKAMTRAKSLRSGNINSEKYYTKKNCLIASVYG
jgi:hypothetical protein